MESHVIQPFILGSGRAGQAIAKGIQIVALQEPDLGVAPPQWLKRGQALSEVTRGVEKPVLVVANPAGLHAEALATATEAGFFAVLTEKPVCVTLAEVAKLRELTARVAVMHVYRQMWGPQLLAQMLEAGELGEIISLESRYWQPSVAHRSLEGNPVVNDWKNDTQLNGNHDVLLDLGTHWADLIFFLMKERPVRSQGWASYINAEAPHRDTHLHLTFDFAKGARAFGSLSKVVHGATNGFEVNVLGAKGSATWNFLAPDELILGKGRDRTVITRKDSAMGGKQPPFHGMGWLEGYTEIIRQAFFDLADQPFRAYPTLGEGLDVVDALLSIKLDGQNRPM